MSAAATGRGAAPNAGPAAPILEAVSLSFAYPGGGAVLRDFSLSVAPGEMVAILGANGAGKSTALNLLSGYLRPASGAARLAGRPVRDYPAAERARLLALVPQAVAGALPYTVEEIVRLGRFRRHGPWRGPGPEDARVVDAALASMELTPLRGRSFPQLSAGERQRVLLAAALAQEPQAVLLDEPTAALDLGHAARLMAALAGRRDAGLAVVFVAHDVQLAAAWADRVAVLREGRVLAIGRPREVVTPGLVREIYGVEAHVVPAPDGAVLVAAKREPCPGRG